MSDEDEPFKIVSSKPSDAEVASGLRRQIVEASEPLIAVINMAKQAGFFVNFGIDDGSVRADGKRALVNLTIVKFF